MNRKVIVLLTLALAFSQFAKAQTNAKPCAAPESNQFDFWVGDWNGAYGDTAHATNAITKEFDGCLIHEHFNDPAQYYKGESWSMYNPKQQIWQQTWVDNQGAYIALTGKFENNEMTLSTQPKAGPNGKPIVNRMVYSNITKDSFDWRWESTQDEGKTWTENWKIRYTRKK